MQSDKPKRGSGLQLPSRDALDKLEERLAKQPPNFMTPAAAAQEGQPAPTEEGPPKFNPPRPAVTRLTPPHFNPEQPAPAQSGLTQVNPPQVTAEQPGLTQVSPVQVNPAQPGAGQGGLAQVNPPAPQNPMVAGEGASIVPTHGTLTRVSAYTTPELAAVIKRMAKQDRRSESYVVGELIAEALAARGLKA